MVSLRTKKSPFSLKYKPLFLELSVGNSWEGLTMDAAFLPRLVSMVMVAALIGPMWSGEEAFVRLMTRHQVTKSFMTTDSWVCS